MSIERTVHMVGEVKKKSECDGHILKLYCIAHTSDIMISKKSLSCMMMTAMMIKRIHHSFPLMVYQYPYCSHRMRYPTE